jgi:WD40 repeat protein/serine/threonine protein kinase
MSIISRTDAEASPPPQVRVSGAARERDTGRNLLFGLLALQNHFVDREALLAGFNAWVADKGRSLAQILVEQGSLTPARQAVLESLVQEHLATHGGDVETSLAAAGGLGAVRGVLGRINDLELHATLDRVPAIDKLTQRDGEATLSYSADVSVAAASRFAILRPHAKGGLGQVSIALDHELNREVALKEMRPEYADNAPSRARFLLEAEITGRLEHPGVVPVYGLGCDAQHRPFYAMRLIKGESLKEAIERFHAKEAGGTSDPRWWNLALRQLLNRFVAVCNVVAYAHSRGVIHRDLKPANILLGPYGETLVVDWGLAKVVGRGEAVAHAGAIEATLQPATGSGSSETLPGTALGTPAYMSPEQAEGRLDQVGPLSDVYCLGATLYALLTGRPSIEETNVGAALRRVQRGEFPPPRSVRPGVPRSLEAICRKAMALQPGDRYGSARALTEEIERWLADEPITAARDPLSTRLIRWGRRHRTLVAGIGALLVTAVGALAISTLLISSERARTEQQRQRADEKTREATERAENLRRQDYVNRVNLAQREVLDDNCALAEDLLEGCPTDLRGWEWDYVRRLYHMDRLTYRGHSKNVRCLAISPDRQWVASGAGTPWREGRQTDRGEVRLWNVDTGQERFVFEGMAGATQGVAFSPDGKLVAAGGGYHLPKPGGWLRVWDVATGRTVWERTTSGTTVMCLAFHPQNQFLAVGHGLFSARKHTGYVRLHRLEDGAPLGTAFGEQAGGVNAMSIDHAGRRLALAGLEIIEIWDPETRARVMPLTGHDRYVYCVAFQPDGKRLASGGWDNTIKLWDVESGATIQTLWGHRGYVLELAFSPDGTRLASVSEDSSVRLREVATGRELAAFHGHAHFVYGLAFHPDGRRILSGSLDGTVKVWDALMSRSVIRPHSTWVAGVAFSRDGRRVYSNHDHARSDEARALKAARPALGFEGTKVWDPITGVEERRAAGAAFESNPEFERGGEIGDYVVTSPDGRRIVRSSPPGLGLEVVDAATERVLFPLKGHVGFVKCVAFAPDGRRIATAGFEDRTIKLWDAADGREVITLRGHTAGVICVAFSPDGRRIVSGSIDDTARIWDATPLEAGAPPGADPTPANEGR